jgi:beta-lactamase regulating signal transducer with metallopeptidase domain
MGEYLNQIINYLLTQSWQIIILVIVIAAISWLLRNKSAHIRYLLWLIVLAKCLMPPLVTIPVAVLPQERPPETITILPDEMPLVTGETSDTTIVAESPVPVPISVSAPVIKEENARAAISTRQWLGIGWILGAIVFGIIALTKALQTNFWLRRRRKSLPAEMQAKIEVLLSDLRLRVFPNIWLIDGIGQPFVWGLLRGSIYLPVNFIKIDNIEHCKGILGHELSHVLRFDAAVNFLQVIAQAIFWFHPFVWWMNMRIRAEREKCCDEMAIAHLGAHVRDYSIAIVNILVEEHKLTRPVPSLAIAGPVKNIEERIKTMLRPGKKFYRSPSIVAVTVAILLALLIVPLAFVLTARAGTNPSTGQWTKTNGPYSAMINCFAVSGKNLFAGTNGGVYLSTNDGASWNAAGLINTDISALALSGENLFAATYRGVFLSSNYGKSWNEVNNGLTNTDVVALAVSGKNLFAGTFGGGIFLSTNNGTSWTEKNNDQSNIMVRALAISGENLFAATNRGVFLSTDNGTSWTEVNNGLSTIMLRGRFVEVRDGNNISYLTTNSSSQTSPGSGTPTNIAALAVSGKNIFAGTSDGVFLSTNNGTSWKEVMTNFSVAALAVSGTTIFTGGRTINISTSTNRVLSTSSNNQVSIFRSTDNGTTWTAVNIGITDNIKAITISGNNVFAGSSGGVLLSTNNGASCNAVNNGFTNAYVNTLAISGENLFAATSGGVFLSANNGTSWTNINKGLPSTISIFAVSGKNLFAGIRENGIFLSTDNGTSWKAVNNGLTNLNVHVLAVCGTTLFAGTSGASRVVTSSTNQGQRSSAENPGGVFRSIDNGTTWTVVNNGLPEYPSVLAFAGNSANLFAVVSGNFSGNSVVRGVRRSNRSVFLSTNNGASWNEVNTGLTDTFVNAIAVSGKNLFAGTNDGVFRSTDNGTTWEKVNNGLTNLQVGKLIVNGTNLFAVSEVSSGNGIFLSTDNGANWTSINTGLMASYVNSLAVSDKNLFAGTDVGLWMLPDFLRNSH